MFDDFNFFGGPGDPGGPNEPLGGVAWHIVFICVATMLFVGFLKWMS